MNHISSNLLTVATRTSSKLQFLSSTRPRRSEPAAVDSDDFSEAIDCRTVSPVIEPTETNVTLNSLLMVRLGFKINISDDVKLLWIRFEARVSNSTDLHSQSENPEIRSFVPHRVEQDLVLGGRFMNRDDGTLWREQVSSEEAAPSATRFKPFSLGYKVDAAHVVWDFLPIDGRPPTSTDKLVIAVNARGIAFRLSQSLQISATHQMYGTANFEYPTETEIVKSTQPIT